MFNWFSFGRIKFNNEVYDFDVWINKEGDCLPRRPIGNHHFLTAEELKDYLKPETEILIFGTGDPGAAKLTEDAKKLLKEKDIKFIEEPTPQAIKTYNKLKQQNKKITAVMHVTC